jgi:ribosomal protein L11 methyltransferase
MELSLDTNSEAVDWACTLLASTPYQGEIRVTDYSEDSDQPWSFTLYLYLPEDAQTQAQDIANVLLPLHRTGIATELQMRRVETIAPSHDSRLIHRVGRFVITAPCDIYEAARQHNSPADEIPLQIKPSLAFGSGLHPATRLTLRLLEQGVKPGMQTLDLGSGSGILSIAIAKLGAQVLAVDNDAIAVQATADAVQLNGVSAQVRVQQGSLGRGSELGHWMGEKTIGTVQSIDALAPFDLIVANILGRVHVTLAPDFRQALNPGGTLITAGFTTDYEEDVRNALVQEGFAAIACERYQEWVAWMYRFNP